ncbi:uncharacterized protein LOC127859002 [Dreissena polymorpha]|uniref:Uncharacterized protein n=1 Tax=Dreissena polymorpha TaxID=45954 RepID=A0A9D4BRS6_DREPO|nr:uncharacterized protein LOC127859002 [Dreissena polymorpha]KAH3706715.1 hypothetical protein DPMN_066103 [Dreissena polymorpha]
MFQVILCASIFALSGGLMFDDGPCDLSPNGMPDPDHSMNYKIEVPKSCVNGTFRWDYPRGTAVLYFADYTKTTTVCFRELVGGWDYTLTDLTPGHGNATLPHIQDRDRSIPICTNSTFVDSLVIQVKPDHLVYVGEFIYQLKFK